MRKSMFMRYSRLRGMLQNYTQSEVIVDACMRVCGSAVGFNIEDPELFSKEDRAFLKRVKRLNKNIIDNSPIWYRNEQARRVGCEIIKKVQVDLRDIV